MRRRSGATRRRGAGARRGGQAQRPRQPLRRRVAPLVPSRSRLVAALLAALLVAGFAVLVTGPWLVITTVDWEGRALTDVRELRRGTSGAKGQNALLLDSTDLRRRLEALPAVAEARVEVQLPGRVAIALVEEPAAVVWETRAARLVAAADGTIIGEVARDRALPAEMATLPLVDDRRSASRTLATGDRVDRDELATALRLAALDPALLGSTTDGFSVHVDEEYGFVLESTAPAWSAAFGFYGIDPEALDDAAARIERQVAAVRTLFSEEEEAGIAWLDVRNPGRVYWRPRG